MAENVLKPPAPRNQEEFAKLDKAAQEAVSKLDEQARVAFEKALQLQKEANELAKNAGYKDADKVKEFAPLSDEATAEEKGKRKEGKKSPLKVTELPKLPVQHKDKLVKLAARDAMTKIDNLLESAKLFKDHPERLTTLWMGLHKAIRSAGLGEAEVKAAIGKVSGAVAVNLCLNNTDDVDLDAWARRLSAEYLTVDQTATLNSRCSSRLRLALAIMSTKTRSRSLQA
jgi:hypothetical protein